MTCFILLNLFPGSISRYSVYPYEEAVPCVLSLLFYLLLLFCLRRLFMHSMIHIRIPRYGSIYRVATRGRWASMIWIWSVPSGVTQEGTPGDELDMLLKERQLDTSQILFDYKIDPARYILGPGDELGIYFWGENDKEFRNTVSPEGLLIIPTVGAIEVAEMTLEAAIQSIKEKVDTKYNGLDITVFLVKPRQFRLFISGLVLQPGMISANANERVSDIVDRVGLMYAEQTGIQDQYQDIETLRDTNTRGTNSDRRPSAETYG